MVFDPEKLSNVVLVADANEDIRCIVADALDCLRTNIVQAANVYEVFEHAARGGVILVVTDLEMPGCSIGYIGELRRHLPCTPILVVTALDWISQAHTRANGASGYLKKPFRIRQLRAIVAQLLGEACHYRNTPTLRSEESKTSFQADADHGGEDEFTKIPSNSY
jgi:DNA-binding response OmpR family regulator